MFSSSAIVIGGGIAGASCAYALGKRGYDVLLIERHDDLAQEASGNPSGVIMPHITHQDDPLGQWHQSCFDFTHKLLNQLELPSFNACGVLDVLPRHVERCLKNSTPYCEVMPPEAVTKLSHGLIRSQGVFYHQAGVIAPKLLCQTMIESCQAITIQYNTQAITLRRNNNHWSIIDIHGEPIASAGIVVIANASDAKRFEQCNYLPLLSFRGQLSYITQRFELPFALCHQGYLLPWDGEKHVLGSTYHQNDFDMNVRDEDHRANIARMADIVEINAQSIAGGRAAMRTALPDRRAVIGKVIHKDKMIKYLSEAKLFSRFKDIHLPEECYHEGLYISAGHGSRGLIGAPYAAEMIATMLETSTPSSHTDFTHSGRFLYKAIKQKIL